MSGVGQVIDAFRLVLAAGAARVLSQDFYEFREFFGFDALLQFFGKLDFQLLPRGVFDPAATGILVAIGKGNVGLDVEDWRAVAQVCTKHVDDGSGLAVLYAIDFHAGETYRIGPKGAACGKNAYALGAA